MSQKIFLTSALAMGVIAPAIAEPSHTDTFPSDGYMQEDYTYTNAATSTNMDGVYSGTVNATAEYDTIDYILTAGKYLPADSETITTCPAGSFCAGGTTVQYNQSSAQGIETCPTGYASSADGSSSNTQCYRACDINNVGDSVTAIAHATAISGNDYYGSGVDTCEPTACENGWHVKAAVTAPDLTSLIGVSEKLNGVTANDSAGNDAHTEGISNTMIAGEPSAFVLSYANNKGMIKGHGICSKTPGDNNNNTWSNPTKFSSLVDETGQEGAKYCYCHLDSYTPINGDAINLSSSWLFAAGASDASECASYCGGSCVIFVAFKYEGYHAALLSSVESSPAMCEANVININWSDVDPATAGQNNENTATYGSDVRTPVKATTKKGKTFRGWRFSAPEQTNLSD